MSRRIGRILAFQTLYSWSVGEIPIDNLLDFSWVTRDKDEDDVPSEKSSEKSLEQVIGEGEKPVPVNGVSLPKKMRFLRFRVCWQKALWRTSTKSMR